MRKTTLFLLMLTFAIRVCAQDKLVAEHYQTAKFNVAIFPANTLDMIPGKRFTPTKQEVEIAENALKTQLADLNKPLTNQYQSPVIHKQLKEFNRQYFGYEDDKGNRILLINCFWKKSGHNNWLNTKVTVLDGGSYYWEVKFDLKKAKLYDLYVNGNA